MIYSLRFKLLAAFAAVFIVSVGTVYFFVNRTASDQIQKLEALSDQARVMRIGSLLSFYYANNKSWDGVQSTLQTIASVESAHLVLVNTSGKVG